MPKAFFEEKKSIFGKGLIGSGLLGPGLEGGGLERGGGVMVIDCVLTTLLHSYSLCVYIYIYV